MTRADIIHLVLIVSFIGLSINLTRTTISMLKNVNRLRDLEVEVATLEDKTNRIKESIEYKKTDVFVEEFARNELNLVKPGEDVVIVSNKTPENTEIITTKDIDVKKDTVFLKWVKLLF